MTVNNEGWGSFKTNKWLFTTPSSSYGRPRTPVSNSRVTEGEINGKVPESPSTRTNRLRTLSDRGNEILDNHEAVKNLYAWNWSEVRENYPERGIHNPSIYCYAISCVQLLSHVPAVVRILQDHRCQDPTCLCCNWKKYFLQSQNHAGSIAWFREAFKRDKKFNQGRQEDAHDALLAILGKIDQIALQNPRLKDRKVADDLYGYSIRNEVQCRVCKNKHVYYENNTVMTVRMLKKDPSGRHHSIKELMQSLFNASTIYGYTCGNCKKKTDAPVKPTLLRAPQVLILHISRFSFDGWGKKILRPVLLNETLDVSSMATANASTVYKLCGAIIHGGTSLDYGHYWCIARSRKREQQFITLNDSSVSNQISSQDARQSYIVLYRRAEHLAITGAEKSMI
uniref:Ubiquitin carboxyl-terminal hydrolase 36 n=1 Tax=Caenorhabditis tropicalis TaxID=1561998 RepID=A0A1I7TXX8_9PELO